jgi:two-component system chemotaxis sensor kinase CheA
MAAPRLFEFLAEAREHLTDVCDQLLRLERATGDGARDYVQQMQRAVHSIKGGAGFFGLRNVEQLAHLMESVLEAVVAHPTERAGPMVDVLLTASDRLAALFDDIENSNQADISNVVARLNELQAVLEQGELPASPPNCPVELLKTESTAQTPTAAIATHKFDVAIDLSHCQAQGLSPREVIERVMQFGQIVTGTLELPNIDLAIVPTQHPIVWRGTITSALDEVTFQDRLAIPLPDQHVAPSVQTGPWASAAAADVPAPAGSATIRIPVELVDRLMSLAGELVLVRNQSRRFTDQDLPLPGQVIQRLDSVTSEFQETVLQTRMQPVGNLFNKFPRLVRDLSRQLGKQLELQIDGTEVELDKTILDALSDPLTHLVRNACDHGLESSEERKRAGKPATGRLRLAARHFGDQIWITIEDDGRGIDRDRVRKKALEQGQRTAEELARLDDRELLSLIMLPGFSTAAQVTDVSGRGVGMDVVKTNLARMGGSIEINSRLGTGTTFTLRLPLTLAIIPTLLVCADGERFAIPQKDLEELVFVDSEQAHVRLERSSEGELARLRGRLLPLVRLGQVLKAGNLRRTMPDSDDRIRLPLLFAVVRAGMRRFGLVVDSILTSEDIVVKPMHTGLRQLTMYSGATVLGDGRVALILNTEGIAQNSRIRFHGEADVTPATSADTAEDRQVVLLVRQLTGEPLAIPLAFVQRIVMITPEQIERVSGGFYANIDNTPTRLFAARGELQIPSETQPLFVVLARNVTPAGGCLVREIVGTEQFAVSALHSLGDAAESLGGVIIGGQITPLADFSGWVEKSRRRSTEHSGDKRLLRHRVLLVDDTQFFRDVVGRYLSEHGYQVTTAEHGENALALLEREQVDIVVSDLEMPIMDGWSLAAAIRHDARFRHLPLLALTTLAGDDAEAKSLAHGFDAHEVKLDRASLLKAIEGLIAQRPSRSGAAEHSHA